MYVLQVVLAQQKVSEPAVRYRRSHHFVWRLEDGNRGAIKDSEKKLKPFWRKAGGQYTTASGGDFGSEAYTSCTKIISMSEEKIATENE